MPINPYLEFFRSLPPSFRQSPAAPPAFLESSAPDWLSLKFAVARHFSWAVPTEAAIARIQGLQAPIVEIGAGSGYWAWMMRQAGIDVAAFDLDPPAFTWTEVARGDQRRVFDHANHALFLCWPPYGVDMAYEALAFYRGTHVIYVGEWMLGCANDRFFRLLVELYDAVEAVDIPRWHARADRLLVFRRKRL